MANRDGLKFGEGTIVARPSGAYQCRYVEHHRDGSTTRRARSFATREAAEDFLREQYRKRRSVAYSAPELRTVEELVADYLERGIETGAWTSNTGYSYLHTAGKHLYPTLGKLRVDALTPPRVQHWIDAMTRKGYSASLIRGAHQILGGAYRELVRLGVLPTSPTTGVRLPAAKPKPIPTWTREEVVAVMASLAEQPMWRALYHLAINTGMRPGELRVLRWSDLLSEERVVLVQRTATRDERGSDVEGATTKTKRPRRNAISSRTLAVLLAWREAQAEQRRLAPIWQLGDHMFTTHDGRYLTRYLWDKEHLRICREAGVRSITRHQALRHSNATLELAAGTPLKIVSDRLGHTRPEFTARIYQHVSPEVAADASDALDERLFGSSGDMGQKA